MLQRTINFLFLALLPIIIARRISVTINDNKQQIEIIRDNFRSIVEEGTISADQVNWNPTLIINKPLLTWLSKANKAGNYQNPFNCSQFLMCDGFGSVWVWECPARGSYYPINDICVYPGSPSEQCPWRSTWYSQVINCENFGKRPYWGPITLPSNPQERCGREIFYCQDSKQYGVCNIQYLCPEGYGYSKGYFACLPIDKCNEVDDYFGL